ncbi:PIN-like domain-containing protein [Gluconobacter cerinus]|uniref:PIN like domain-containing protein n=1 Tax=Gluconobacter cerinus TaxID=38307 RepID=A0AAV5N926_9PROT|nr:PIN domain-containing protein [Gluconobacter cerinus]GBR02129.1 hypothetical protein AA0229_1614 [Gluconobacter cerinus NRIC 0229]GLQ61257.1 hypothetical protein GCM10007867_01020 [Gluconobacter cerinus]
MKEQFHHLFPPTEAEFRSMWENGIFSFDANVLLSIYRYSEETSKALLSFIMQADKVRLPHQFALEFMRNRAKVIVAEANKYQAAYHALEKIEQGCRPKSEHPHLSAPAQEAIALIKEELSTSRKQMEGLISNDDYVNSLHEAISEKIGQEPSESELSKLHVQAADRFRTSIPPGFADAKTKAPPECYGDYVAWAQLINIAATEKRDLIFVTDDAKADWWRIESGRTIGPRPELLLEFKKLSGQRVWFYPSDRFLSSAETYLKAQFGEKVIEEVEARVAQEREEEEAKRAKPDVPRLDSSSEDKHSPSIIDKTKTTPDYKGT